MLTASDRDAMFVLMERYYEGTTREEFEGDLDGKQHLIRMFDKDGGLCGFSTIQLIPFEHEGKQLLALFSGDTVIDRACWGQKQLQIAFGRFLLHLLITRKESLYWFLISKGYKTYLFMRNNLRATSYPNHERSTPPTVKALLDHVATLKYPKQYDSERGVISFPGKSCAVKGSYGAITDQDLENSDIRFFVEQNPGHVNGDELCCLAHVTWGQVAYAVFRYTVAVPFGRLFGGKKRASKTRRPEPAKISTGS